jgi:hypothetical protein
MRTTTLADAQVIAEAVRCADGWRARTIRWLTSGTAEVYECRSSDPTETLALQRARLLVLLRYSPSPAIH